MGKQYVSPAEDATLKVMEWNVNKPVNSVTQSF